jgi:putative transposase
MTFALKSVRQSYSPSPKGLELMDAFRQIVNDCIRIGLESGASSLKTLCTLSYRELRGNYGSIPSYYRLTAISIAAGILAARKKSLRRGIPQEIPI